MNLTAKALTQVDPHNLALQARETLNHAVRWKVLRVLNPTNATSYGPDLSDEVVLRWKSYLSVGVDKDIKNKLLEKIQNP